MEKPNILCIGSVLWDIIGRCNGRMANGHDRPGIITHLPGGVAMNIAMTLAKMGFHPALLSVLGDDLAGRSLEEQAEKLGVNTKFIHKSKNLPTDRYIAIEDTNGLFGAIADAHSLEAAGTCILSPLSDGRLGSADAPWKGTIAIDGNLTEDVLGAIVKDPCFNRADLRIAPASPGKATRLSALCNRENTVFYVNRIEAGLILHVNFDSAIDAARAMVAGGFSQVVVTDGPDEAAVADTNTLYRATPPKVEQVRVTGAGDTLMAAHIAAQINGASPSDAFEQALERAARYVAGENDV